MNSDDGFSIVYKSIVHNYKPNIDRKSLFKAVRSAHLNKVLLHFLRVANINGKLRTIEEMKYRRFLQNLRIVSDTLYGLNYVFIKLRKPLVYVPSDIDVLIAREHIPKAIVKLKEKGFKLLVVEPYCVSMKHENTIIDLYVYPTLGGMIYIDSSLLKEHKEITLFNSIEIPTLKIYAEVLITMAHAIYKERIYTLNDYLTVKKWFSAKAIMLAKESHCFNAVKEALKIHKMVEKNRITLPYKIPFVRWLKILEYKVYKDKYSRGTVFNILKTLKDHRIGKLVFSKLIRDTY